MALIKCPDCGKEISDRAVTCINCGCPINEIKEQKIFNIDYFILYDVRNHKRAPLMLNKYYYVSGIANHYKPYENMLVDLYDENFNLISTTKLEKVDAIDPNSEEYKTPNFHILMYSFENIYLTSNVKYIVEHGKEINSQICNYFISSKVVSVESTLQNKSEISCPKCGSTQIQIVARKWSLMTGLLTNKVDRVCMKCKHKF
ncbi:MAG: zinc ribbon domain-containing protein [Clostridia bacterium]